MCIEQETCANTNKTFPKNSQSFTRPNNKIVLLDALKPPGDACALETGSGAIGAAAAAAGTGAAGEGREPTLSKPDSRRSFCTGATAGARAGVAVGARVGDMRPEREKRNKSAHPNTSEGGIHFVFSTSTNINKRELNYSITERSVPPSRSSPGAPGADVSVSSTEPPKESEGLSGYVPQHGGRQYHLHEARH